MAVIVMRAGEAVQLECEERSPPRSPSSEAADLVRNYEGWLYSVVLQTRNKTICWPSMI